MAMQQHVLPHDVLWNLVVTHIGLFWHIHRSLLTHLQVSFDTCLVMQRKRGWRWSSTCRRMKARALLLPAFSNAFLHNHRYVCCSVLQCFAVCCNVLQCAAVCCSALQCVARALLLPAFSNAFSHNRRCLHVLQYAAECCSVLQCVAVCCSALQCVVRPLTRTQKEPYTHSKQDSHAIESSKGYTALHIW